MEGPVLHQGQKQNPQITPCSSGLQKDFWHVVREGSLADVESALFLLKKNGGNINSRNTFGVAPLHVATWRNHIPIVRRLLAAGADPDARDGESGWSSLHRALHFGHLAVASILLHSGASILLEDSKSRTPIDLLSGPVVQVLGNGKNSVKTELLSWGSGVNYQLGTGNAHIQKLPCKVDSLHGVFIKLISAAKFHSVAVSADGEVYTWGFGRGGRLGHSDFDIHSGQAATITPRKVTFGLGSRRVRSIAAAKHHTVAATVGGEVFTWGSNREGQLGYTSVDTQPTPRRVSSLRSRIVAVAAANKHTAVISESGEIFTWGCNREGQLGYGTSNSASNYTPRLVECLKGKVLIGVAAAKYHTIVLGADGEVFTWGHRLVTPRRVIIARNLKKAGTIPLKFHCMERLHVVSVVAGMVHSMALTDDGALFYWVSSDPDLRCQQLYSVCGRHMVNISAGKYWTAAVTDTGNVYLWDGKKSKDKPLVATRLHSVKKATLVSVGETHMLIVGSLYHPACLSGVDQVINNSQNTKLEAVEELEELDEDFMSEGVGFNETSPARQNGDIEDISVPSLKSLCEKVAAECLVEPRNSIQMLEIADSLGADDLRKHCEDIAIHNLDYILAVSGHTIANASLDVLANLEKLLDSRSSDQWSHHRLPTPTATFPAIINSDEDNSDNELLRTHGNHSKKGARKKGRDWKFDCFIQQTDNASIDNCKQVRALRKKLQQIQMLELKQSEGYLLDNQQFEKLQTKLVIESLLAEHGVPVDSADVKALSSVPPAGKGNRMGKASRKQRKKSKQKADQVDTASFNFNKSLESNSAKELLNVDISLASKDKVDDQTNMTHQVAESSSVLIPKKGIPGFSKDKNSIPSASKKKKKGGLSMFLSGALDDVPKDVAPPIVVPKVEGPVWGGGLKLPKGSASLRDIQNEQSKRMGGGPSAQNKDQVENSFDSSKFQPCSFLPSNPIPVVVQNCASPDGERSTPPWHSPGTPPLHSRPSLRDIQMQQGKKQQQGLFHSPAARTTGFSIPSGQGSPSESPGPNRWFKPDADAPSSIRSIQIEERAMKDLKRFYSSVKVVQKPTLS